MYINSDSQLMTDIINSKVNLKLWSYHAFSFISKEAIMKLALLTKVWSFLTYPVILQTEKFEAISN